ncbi:taste receptor type 2 member 40-like [Latimeria chalumnae]|uniref:taste receptor type 2 member 40-like n=1 Tax=Latimeria chalumnae TaxID=7897 RepID=UPI0006D8DA6F|nr:PREDICTED: taste receptor type 2 member 40-like [Latimeria chalumnae]|eukprot:XP_014353874.1 PREDICTED: taste receptor type 2 member 40-like [Latimeria chalumnae]
MAATGVIVQLVVEFMIVLIGLVGNVFIVVVYVSEYRRTKALQPSELIVAILAFFNILIQINMLIWFVVYLFNFCTYFGDDLYKVTDFMSVFLSKSSYWFTAYLCFYYCMKIVKVNWSCFNSQAECFLGAFMLIFSMGIIIFLCRHSRHMTKSGTTGSSSHSDAHTAVAVMLICLIVLYITCTAMVFAANLLVAVVESDILVAISFTSSIYSAGSSVILIIGTVKLRKSCDKFCCLGG